MSEMEIPILKNPVDLKIRKRLSFHHPLSKYSEELFSKWIFNRKKLNNGCQIKNVMGKKLE
jgi:hypothetical protein